jgi:hypothetical protein
MSEQFPDITQNSPAGYYYSQQNKIRLMSSYEITQLDPKESQTSFKQFSPNNFAPDPITEQDFIYHTEPAYTISA